MSKVAAKMERLHQKVQLRRSAAKVTSQGNYTETICVGSCMVGPSNDIEEFYHAYFAIPQEPKCVVQVGANDGIMCDPLRKYLVGSRNENTQAVLIEPIPFYFERLKCLYADYPNITLLNVACGAIRGSAPLYFIDPDVADQMNGSGPPNNWAHGQGSFDKDIVRYWIERNRFRGDDYVDNVDFYHASIRSIMVPIVRLADLEILQSRGNKLLAIDVQGFEMDVIQGIDWSHPPTYIVFEDDLNRASSIDKYLGSKGYAHLCGTKEKLYTSRPFVRR